MADSAAAKQARWGVSDQASFPPTQLFSSSASAQISGRRCQREASAGRTTFGRAASRPAFDTLVLLVCWMIWKERNTRVFQNQSRTAGFLFGAIKDEAAIWKEAGNNAIKEPINVN
uniref:Uncharacterized protein n=1 Tax=Oryza nivara TaxID=4536 RepID=A0A0E0GH81_ORYNI